MPAPPAMHPQTHAVILGGQPRRLRHEAARRLAAAAAVLTLCAAAVIVGMQGGPSAAAVGAGGRAWENVLLSWSNAADDGSGVLGGQQHGVSMIIHTCGSPPSTFWCSSVPDAFVGSC